MSFYLAQCGGGKLVKKKLDGRHDLAHFARATFRRTHIDERIFSHFFPKKMSYSSDRLKGENADWLRHITDSIAMNTIPRLINKTLALLTATAFFSASSFQANAQAVVQSVTSFGSGGVAASSYSIAKPAGLAVGDLMILSAAIEGSKTFTAPTATGAWTEVIRKANGSNLFIVVLRKTAVQADVNATSFSMGVGGGKYSIGLSRITGHNPTSPIAASAGATGSGTGVEAPAITTTAANQLVLSFHGVKKSASFTPSGSFGTEIYDVAAEPPSLAAYRYVQAGAGSTGTKTATSSQSEQWVGIQVAIASVPASPTIAASGSVTARSTTYGTASSAASFTVSGSALTGNLTVTPPAGFQTSLAEGSGYGSSTSITASGTLASTTVFVRLAAATAPGSYSGNISIAGGGATSQSIAIASSTVAAKALTVTGLTGTSKVYNRSTAASASGTAALSGVVGADAVTLSGSPVFTFASANVGTGIAIATTGYTLSGANAGNYTLTQPSLTANITAKALTITGLTGSDKEYDGSTAGSANGTAALSGVESPDAVSISGTPVFTFVSSNVGTGIAITTTGYTLAGAAAGNYSLTQPSLSANITAKELTVTGITGANKAFTGDTTATVNGTAALSGVVSPDAVSLSGTPSFAFASANVGTGIEITTTGYTLSGAAADNYTLIQPILSANITGKELTVTGLVGNDKEYDGLTIASASGTATLAGLTGSEQVTLVGTPAFTFASANVGTGIAITTTGYTLAGAAAGNYSLTQPSLSANITAKELTVTGITGANKAFTGDTTATVNGTAALSGVVSPDAVSLSGTPSFAFASANVGTGIEITTTGYTLSGAAADNYTLIQPILSANITGKELTVTGLVGNDKEYDGLTIASASGTATLAGLTGSEQVTLVGTPAFTFASANVGTGIAITTTGYLLAGADAANYALTQPSLTASITAKPLTITGLIGDSKVYDQNTDVTVSGEAALSGVLSPDDVKISGFPESVFSSSNAGADVPIVTTGYTLDGKNAGNYSLIQPTLSAAISPKPVTIIGLSGISKVYDGTTTAATSGSAVLEGVLEPDVVNLSGTPSFSFASPKVGTAVKINVDGFTLAGKDAANYILSDEGNN